MAVGIILLHAQQGSKTIISGRLEIDDDIPLIIAPSPRPQGTKKREGKKREEEEEGRRGGKAEERRNEPLEWLINNTYSKGRANSR